MSESKKYLLLLLALYCLARLPIMLSNPTTDGMEFLFGAISVELLEGPRLPIWDYHPDPYGSGHLLSAVWTTPFFAIFGKSLFASKLAPFTWHLFSLLAWFFIFKGHFSIKRTFLIILTFLVLPPSPVIELFLENSGYHFYMILWMALSILLFRSFLNGGLKATKAGLILGFLGGFSCLLIITNLITQIVLWLYLALQKGKIQKKNFYLFYTIGFLIGFSPFVLYNWSIDWLGFKAIFKMFFLESQPWQSPIHMFKLFFICAINFQGFLGSRIYAFLYLISLFLLWRRNKSFWKGLENGFNIEAFGLIFQILFVSLVIVKLHVGMAKYYLFPLVPFMGMSLMTMAKNHNWFQKGVLFYCVGIGVLSNISQVHLEDWGRSLKVQGYSYQGFGGLLERNFGDHFSLFKEKFQKSMKGRSFSQKEVIVRNLTSSCFQLKDSVTLQRILSFISEEEVKLQPLLYEKLGMQLGSYSQFDSQRLEILLGQHKVSPEFFPDIYRSVVQGLGERKGISLCHFAPPSAKPGCYEGLGFSIELDRKDHWVVSGLEQKYVLYYFRGVGEILYHNIEDAKLVMASFSSSERDWVLEGFQKEVMKEEDPFVREEIRKKLFSQGIPLR